MQNTNNLLFHFTLHMMLYFSCKTSVFLTSEFEIFGPHSFRISKRMSAHYWAHINRNLKLKSCNEVCSGFPKGMFFQNILVVINKQTTLSKYPLESKLGTSLQASLANPNLTCGLKRYALLCRQPQVESFFNRKL